MAGVGNSITKMKNTAIPTRVTLTGWAVVGALSVHTTEHCRYAVVVVAASH